MVQSRRRVSYVIPPPLGSVPYLRLPPCGISRLGSIAPLLLPSQGHVEERGEDSPTWSRHPRHRLGVASLALDTSTHLAGRNAPEGILYTGGRDGLVLSWDLGVPMKKRKLKEDDGLRRSGGRWEIMTGWGDDVIDEEGEEGDERPTSDGDILGEVTAGSSRRGQRILRRSNSLPLEHQWETDLDTFKPGTPSQFRQCVQTHSDWVNDILLCNYNQTVISASSDGTIKAWNPHSAISPDPSPIGSHSDYVRCLAYCREQNWIASGSFDRTIKLWDLNRSAHPATTDPLMTLNPPDATAPKSSVYAIAADPFGHAIASGSPERVIRMWDPRSGRRIGKLVGHTDNIRAILISEDSKYLLTGSTDASIKLWSLASQRCLHTFTHHTESVWSLFSSHPSLETFYSGDRSGLVCKVDVEDCSDVSEGECIVLCQDSGDRGMAASEGINKIAAMDDNLLWTASGNSSIKCWRVPQRHAVRASALILDFEAERHVPSESPLAAMFKRRLNNAENTSEVNTRPSSGHGHRSSLAPSVKSLGSDSGLLQRDREEETTLYGIPFESLVRLTSPNGRFTSYTAMGRDPEVATLYSAASVMSVPRANAMRSPINTVFQQTHTSPMRSSRTEDTCHPVNTARADYEERELAADAVPLYIAPDDIIAGDHGLVRSTILNDRIHALTVDTSGEVAVWDIVRGTCNGRFLPEDVAAASHRGSTTGGSSGGERERSPREALETVRELIEGEAVVAPWCTADTKAGVLAIHMNEKCFEAEIYADEVGFAHDRHFNDESKLNIGKWVLRNLFLGFIREEQRARRNRDNNNSQEGIVTPSLRQEAAPNHIDSNVDGQQRHSSSSTDSSRRSPRSPTSSTVISSSKMIPAVSPIMPSSIRSSPLLTSLIPLLSISKDNNIPLPSIPQSPSLSSNDVTPMPRHLRSGTSESGQQPPNLPPSIMPKDGDYFAVRPRQASIQGGVAIIPDDFAGFSGSGKADPGAQTPSTPGGLMGRLKSLGKISSKRPPGDITSSPIFGSPAVPSEAPALSERATRGANVAETPLQILLSKPLTPPPNTEAPSHTLPPNITLLISEEASPSWTTLYRGTVSSAYHDMHALEEAMPTWLLEYLLLNQVSVPQNKLSFILLPWANKDPDGEQLPELLNTSQSKLTASRSLRVRKLVVHVQEKLENSLGNPGSAGSSFDDKESSASLNVPLQKAEDIYEILCNDVLLPLDMNLAAIRQFVWRQSGDLTMHYRRKRPTAPLAPE